MTILHVRTGDGPRPVSPATVRALLASGGLRRDQRALSADGGATWVDPDTALAEVGRDAVGDAALSAACAESGDGLHPLALPAATIVIAGFIIAIGVGGGPSAGIIRAAPAQAAETVLADVSSLGAEAAAAAAGAIRLASDAAGALWYRPPVPMPAIAGHAVAASTGTVPAAQSAAAASTGTVPAASTGTVEPANRPAVAVASADELLATWRDFLAQGANVPAATWKARADALGEQTVRLGLARWPVHLSACETVGDADRVRGIYHGVAKPLREAIFDVPSAGAIAIGAVTEDAALAKRLDALSAKGKGADTTLTATCLGVSCDPDKRTIDLLVVLTSVE